MSDVGFELSIAQRQLLGVERTAPARVVAISQDVDGVEAAGLSERLRELVRQHDVLRTRFLRPSGFSRVVQAIGEPGDAALEDAGTTTRDALEALRLRPFDLTTGPALRLLRTATSLVLAAPAAVADAHSLGLLLSALRGDRPLDEDPLQFVDYASWEAEQLADDGADARIARAYWARAGGSADDHELPALAVRPGAVPVAGSHPAEEWLAAWLAVLQRHAAPGTEHVVVALAVPGRGDDELESAIGPYERYVPLALAVDPAATMADLVPRVRAEVSAATNFALYAPRPETEAAFAVRSAAELIPARGAFPLELVVTGSEAELWISGDQVARRRAEFMAAQLGTLLGADPSAVLARVDVRGDAERRFQDETLTGEAADVRPAGDGSVPAVVLAHAERRPDATAVTCGDHSVSYAQLVARASAVAAALGTPSGPVAVLLDRSPDAVAAALGVLLTGVPFLALDVDHPPAFRAEQLAAAGAGTVVTDQAHGGHLPADVRAVFIEDVAPAAAPHDAGPAAAGTVAYLSFTSGSTGRPKPVAVTHGNVLGYARGLTERLGLAEGVRFAAVTGLSTDLGHTALFGALTNGGTYEIVPPDTAVDGPALARLVAEHGVTALKATPSHLRALRNSGDAALALELLVIGGEPLDAGLVAWARGAGIGRAVNHYGPTETTVGALTYDIPDDVADPVPIGRPLPHVRLRIVDGAGLPVPLGATGELLVGGAGVSEGYPGHPTETADRFLLADDGSRFYRTGDLVRQRDDGAVEFRGRADGQVKIRGHRVELGEVEARLREDEAVAQAAVLADGDELLGYLVLAAGHRDADAVRDRLARRVPAHLVPGRLTVLDDLPLTGSGKVDRRRLRDQAPSAPARQVREPGTQTERELLEIWRDVLPGAAIGIDDDFFRIGGHSLLATKVIARARARFRVELPLHLIFASPTVAAMAAEIDGRRARSGEDLGSLLDELDTLSDDEAARLLAGEPSHADDR